LRSVVTDRATKAFMEAIEHEDQSLEAAIGLKRPKPTEVVCSVPKDHAGLQAVDYYLWALQRFYERGEARYLDFIWPYGTLPDPVDIPGNVVRAAVVKH
jgi:hypothetical protein